MKFFITGFGGQLGYDVALELQRRGFNNIYAPTSKYLDITDEDKVGEAILEYRPDIIFHCAAYTAVDKAEDEKEKCYDVNVRGTKNIVKYAEMVGAKVIYISTDYVFDGTKEGYYKEDDVILPINFYGKTKYLGEQEVRKYNNHIITRISWVFGLNGNNFIKTMLRIAEKTDEVSVVADQIGSPTYTEDLSKKLVDMALSDKTGTYHVTNEGICSWYDLASYIFEVNDIDMGVKPILTKDYETKAKRPYNSKLSKEKMVSDGFEKMPDWHDAAERYSKVLKKVRSTRE